jgi:hypothetical protein
MNWNDIVLTVFSGSSPVMAGVLGMLYYRQTKRTKDLDNDRRAIDNQAAAHKIELDAATRSRLVEEAATVNEDREQRREDWWAAQVGVLRSEIRAERELSNQRFKRLNQLEIWATQHVIWDRKAWNKIHELGANIEPPPDLPDEIETALRQPTPQ